MEYYQGSVSVHTGYMQHMHTYLQAMEQISDSQLSGRESSTSQGLESMFKGRGVRPQLVFVEEFSDCAF